MSTSSSSLQMPPLDQLEWLQGSPSDDLTHNIRLLLLIQPNCPGCHIHAIPTANELAATKQDFDIYCVSTAFEDFEVNTIENARLLLKGTLVGSAKEQLESNITRTTNIPVMATAHDIIEDRDDLDPEFLIIAMQASKANTREQMTNKIGQGVLEELLDNADKDMLLPKKVARVFWSVRALGTPMWVLHRQSGEVLDRKFGQFSANELLAWIQPYL